MAQAGSEVLLMAASPLDSDQADCPELIYSEQDDDLKGRRNQRQRATKALAGKMLIEKSVITDRNSAESCRDEPSA